MAKHKFTNKILDDKIAKNIEAGWADKLPEPTDEDFESLDQPPADEANAENLNAYDREVRYGTPLEEHHLSTGTRMMEAEREEYPAVSPGLSGGDVDAAWQEAEENGEESVGGSSPTPDQDQVDQIGRAVGLEFQDNQELHASSEVLDKRDLNRWELDRRSADDASPDFPHKRNPLLR
ncbi:MAG: DUF6335 family protein [Acidobacteriota bacterium]